MYKYTRAFLMSVPLAQLAISQIHIEMITKLFIRDIGFYLFIFIISGLLILFNLSSMKEPGKTQLPMYAIVTVVAAGSGALYLMKAYGDYMSQESVLFEDIRLSAAFVAISIVVYLLGGIVIVSKSLMAQMKGKHA